MRTTEIDGVQYALIPLSCINNIKAFARQGLLYPDENLSFPLDSIVFFAKSVLGEDWLPFWMNLHNEIENSLNDHPNPELEPSERPYTHREYEIALKEHMSDEVFEDLFNDEL